MATEMSSLPQEVTNIIASYLQHRENESAVRINERGRSMLPPYATISRQWQYAIESRTFREIELASTELPYFSHVMHGHRRPMLQTLSLEVILPTYSDKSCAKFETAKEKQVNNQVFTSCIKDLFSLLRSWHDDYRSGIDGIKVSKSHQFRLRLQDCFSPMDCVHRGVEKYRADKDEREFGRRNDLFQHRYESSVIRMNHIEDIREVPQISNFDVSKTDRSIEPRTVALIASKLPNLTGIYWKLVESERRHASLRQQARSDFAKALSMISTDRLREIKLSFDYRAPRNQDFYPPRAVLLSPSFDPLSLALHDLSLAENLTTLTLNGENAISEMLFWPQRPIKRPVWPQLLDLDINFNMTTTEGEWYFVSGDSEDAQAESIEESPTSDRSGATDASSSESDLNDDSDFPDDYNEAREQRIVGDRPSSIFRTKADATKVNPLFAAAAHAAANMPRLQRMTLETQVRAINPFMFQFDFFAPGQETRFGHGSQDVGWPRLLWTVGPSGYVPEESTIEIWRQAKGKNGEIVSRVL